MSHILKLTSTILLPSSKGIVFSKYETLSTFQHPDKSVRRRHERCSPQKYPIVGCGLLTGFCPSCDLRRDVFPTPTRHLQSVTASIKAAREHTLESPNRISFTSPPTSQQRRWFSTLKPIENVANTLVHILKSLVGSYVAMEFEWSRRVGVGALEQTPISRRSIERGTGQRWWCGPVLKQQQQGGILFECDHEKIT